MNSYVQRVGLTAWRKKTSVLVATALLILLMFGVQYSRIDENTYFMEEERDAKVIADALMKSIKNVKFVDKDQTGVDAMVREENFVSKRRGASLAEQFSDIENEQQLGIPFVNLDLKNPYIPERRIVHLDFKGAPSQIAYLKKLFPLFKVMGATGLLIEYEDMFPYQGSLKNISATNAFTVQEVKRILMMAEDAKLEVIPLIQTFGHVEFALKLAEFASLREVPNSPQALCPSRSNSLNFIQEMVNQVMVLHPNSKYLHIGCDEVFQMGECDVCRLEVHENLFLRHIKNVVQMVRSKYPQIKIIVWDDMLRHIPQGAMQDIHLGSLVEPMVWVYAEDIYRFVQPSVWEKYAAVFRTAWTASAFKGAFGETLYIPNARRHLENNLRWLDVMATQASSFKDGMRGLVLTGWQRYDHFAVLCELLPSALPSLALNLIAVSNGYFNSSLRNKFLTALSCPEQNITPFINLDSDPFMWEKLSRCIFPGNTVFRLMNRLHNMETESREFLDLVHRQKGWMTSYNVRHNYSLPLRVDEVIADMPRLYHAAISLAKIAADSMAGIFDNYTISEWIEQKIYPYILEFERIQNDSAVLKGVEQWPVRPLPILKKLQRLGIAL
ncbi:unnamed protein product [Callosobruchus maculatus]|uniref:beta-N-acetylhexosaminidase n=1 Tax=Callosobruchus maculatus TaxID=64391 RepID=A0A653BTL9_CALMS|nr:unnamed protein product [Callosobruchus maculatus]